HYRSLGYREDQLAVVPNGVDVERFTTANPADLTAFGIPDGAQTIISVGRLHPQKGQRHLLSAFERIRNRPGCNRNVHLLLVGDGPDREALESTVRERNLNECVHFAGWQPDTAPLL